MKRIYKFMNMSLKKIFFTFLFLSFLTQTFANVGVGLQTLTVFAIIPSGGIGCITYGVYNPWDITVTERLEPSDEFKKEFNYTLIPKEEVISNFTFIKLQDITEARWELINETNSTYHIGVHKFQVCFKVPDYYKNECPNRSDWKSIKGKMSVKAENPVFPPELQERIKNNPVGSAASIGYSTDLEIAIGCKDSSTMIKDVNLTFDEGVRKNIPYEIYNPFGAPIKIKVKTKINNLTFYREFKLGAYETKTIEMPVILPQVFERNCLFGHFCELKCDAPCKELTGMTVADIEVGGFKTTAEGEVVISVECIDEPRNYRLLFTLIGVALIAVLVVVFLVVKSEQNRKSW